MDVLTTTLLCLVVMLLIRNIILAGKCLFLSGLITEQLNAYDDARLKEYGIGFTNMVERTTRGSADLTKFVFLISLIIVNAAAETRIFSLLRSHFSAFEACFYLNGKNI